MLQQYDQTIEKKIRINLENATQKRSSATK